jgi:hypothetical protein
MAQFAEGTEVSAERSQMEIGSLVRKYGAKSFAYAQDDDRAMVEFIAHERRIRFVIKMPVAADLPRVKVNANSTRPRTPSEVEKGIEQETRRRWRSLTLGVKAKLEMVATGIASFEDEFLAQTVMPDGKTVSEHVQPAVEQAYALGTMPSSLLAITG